MRWIDLFSLPCGALWRQKSRTVLTTLGVVFGSFVLAASLSIGQGVRDTIDRLMSQTDFLRRIEVLPGEPGDQQADTPVLVEGNMTDERRQRLQPLVSERGETQPGASGRALLDFERVQKISGLPHVEAFVPRVETTGFAILEGDQSEETSLDAMQLRESTTAERLIAGRSFQRRDEQSVIVSEFLLYRLGIRSDDELQKVIGRKLTFESRPGSSGRGPRLPAMPQPGTGVTRQEAAALGKVMLQLPQALQHLDLTPEERAALLRLVLQRPGEQSSRSLDLEIVGVLKVPEAQPGGRRRFNPFRTDEELLIPPETAVAFAFESPSLRETGLTRGVLIMEKEEHVAAAVQAVEALGLNAWAPQEFIDRQRTIFQIIFGSMTLIATVALFVAAMGIANTMLMSVIERTREIGVMKAIGASNGQLQTLFLVEGLLIGLVGGVFGLGLAWMASIPGDQWVRSLANANDRVQLTERLFVFPLWINLTVIGFAAGMTTLGAYYPARRAAAIDPVMALRHE